MGDDATVPAGLTHVVRRAGRVVLLDADGAVLLLHGRDLARPDDGTWWFTPGGGSEDGEDLVVATARELWEETGIRVDDLGPPVATRHTAFAYEDWWLDQDETFHVAHVDAVAPAVAPVELTEIERRNLLGSRWWSLRELRATTATIFPDWLPRLVAVLHGEEAGLPDGGADGATFDHAAILSRARPSRPSPGRAGTTRRPAPPGPPRPGSPARTTP